MASYGDKETEALKKNVEEQLNRLMTQLQDCEDLKEELDDEEYESTKADTLQQLKEFEASLSKVNLVDQLGSALQAAVSQAFKTPEVIKMFASKQPRQLRFKLAELEREVKLKNITQEAYTPQAVEILVALKKLGETLTPQETSFLQANMSTQLAEFEKAAEVIGQLIAMLPVHPIVEGEDLLQAAGAQLKSENWAQLK